MSTDETVQEVDLGGRAAVSGGRRCRRLKMVGTMPREPITNLYRGLFDVALMDRPVAKMRRWEVHAIRVNVEQYLTFFLSHMEQCCFVFWNERSQMSKTESESVRRGRRMVRLEAECEGTEYLAGKIKVWNGVLEAGGSSRVLARSTSNTEKSGIRDASLCNLYADLQNYWCSRDRHLLQSTPRKQRHRSQRTR